MSAFLRASSLLFVVVSLTQISACVPLMTNAYASAEEFSRSVRVDIVGGAVYVSSLAMGTLSSDGVGRLRFRFSDTEGVVESYSLDLELLSSRRHQQIEVAEGVPSDCLLRVIERDRVRSDAWVIRVELNGDESAFAKLGGATVAFKSPGARWSVRIPRRLVDGFILAVSAARVKAAQ